jgi:hypothetical protein
MQRSEANEASAAAQEVALAEAGVADSVAFSLVDELLTAKKVDEAQASMLRQKYERLFTARLAAAEKSRQLSKQLRTTHNDVLRDQIQLEKVRSEEAESVVRLRLLESEKTALQVELEQCEEADAAVSFELSELIKTHEELKALLESLQEENRRAVEPVLADLRAEIDKLEKDIALNVRILWRSHAEKSVTDVRNCL